MDLSIQQLRMLRELSRRGTIAAVADHLGYTSSAVSQQLSSAEKATGVAMLERAGRNVLLTDAGRELVTHAHLVLEQLEHAQAAIERVQGDVAGILQIGFIESIGSTMLGPIMTMVRHDHPRLQLHMTAIDSLWPIDLISAGELDIAFVVGAEDEDLVLPAGFSGQVLFRDWFRIVVPASRFAGKRRPKQIDLASMAGDDFIVPPPTDSCGRAAVKACTDAGLDPFVAHRVADYPTTLRLIGAEAGVALVPDLGLRNVPGDVDVFDLAKPKHRTIGLVYRSSSAARPAVQAFLDIVSRVAAGLDLDLVDPTQS